VAWLKPCPSGVWLIAGLRPGPIFRSNGWKQIPFGDDSQKSRGNSKYRGPSLALRMTAKRGAGKGADGFFDDEAIVGDVEGEGLAEAVLVASFYV
jgi:hypothetical protein